MSEATLLWQGKWWEKKSVSYGSFMMICRCFFSGKVKLLHMGGGVKDSKTEDRHFLCKMVRQTSDPN